MIRDLLELLGLVDDNENDEVFEDRMEEEYEERKQRVLRPAPPSASVIICRGDHCLGNMEDLAEAVRKGKIVIADLRKMEREPGQTFLDFISGVTHAAHGVVSRLAPGIFIASPRKSMIEEWEFSADDEILHTDRCQEEEVDDVERTSYRS